MIKPPSSVAWHFIFVIDLNIEDEISDHAMIHHSMMQVSLCAGPLVGSKMDLPEQPPSNGQPADPVLSDRQPADPGLSDSQPADPGLSDSQPADPGLSDSQPADPGLSDSQPADPGLSDSQPADPGLSDSQPADPGLSDSQPADQRLSDSQPADPGLSDSQPADQRLSDSQPADSLMENVLLIPQRKLYSVSLSMFFVILLWDVLGTPRPNVNPVRSFYESLSNNFRFFKSINP